jgi:hypothetical protein
MNPTGALPWRSGLTLLDKVLLRGLKRAETRLRTFVDIFSWMGPSTAAVLLPPTISKSEVVLDGSAERPEMKCMIGNN